MNSTKTIRDAVVSLRDQLSRADIEDARLNAELLVAHALRCDRSDLLVRANESLDSESASLLNDAASRRVKREPLEYIIGWREFYSRRFACVPGVLIPRPETETIVDECKRRLQRDFAGPAVDLGTGCGMVAITLALEFPRLRITATDIAQEALNLTQKNALTHGVSERVGTLRGDWLAPFEPKPQFALIVANPPYVDLGYSPIMQPEVRDFEPPVAVFGGNGGLLHIKAILPQVSPRLLPGGLFCMEFAAGQADDVRVLAEQAGLKQIEIICDFAGIERTLVARN